MGVVVFIPTADAIMSMDEPCRCHCSMKQGGAESRGSETRPLDQLLMKDECDTRLVSSGAFIMPQSTDSASSDHAYVR